MYVFDRKSRALEEVVLSYLPMCFQIFGKTEFPDAGFDC